LGRGGALSLQEGLTKWAIYVIEISNLPVIVCTGFNASLDASHMTILKIRALLHKPILRKDLAETVREILDACQKTTGS
jgi:CheY-like chemotaxis protein